MFWGSFHGRTKGLSLFWEKNWGSINQRIYCERVVPRIHEWMSMHPGLLFMQAGASSHTARATKELMASLGIYPIEWPPFSPDLNPIESV
jgi:hypothetical protein